MVTVDQCQPENILTSTVGVAAAIKVIQAVLYKERYSTVPRLLKV